MKITDYFSNGIDISKDYVEKRSKDLKPIFESCFIDGYFTGVKDVYRDLKIIKANLGLYESKIREVVEYLKDDTDKMWAARIAGIILDCDFRDASQEVKKFLSKETKEI